MDCSKIRYDWKCRSFLNLIALFILMVGALHGKDEESVDSWDFVICSEIGDDNKLRNHDIWKGSKEESSEWIAEMEKNGELIKVLREAGCTGVVFMSCKVGRFPKDGKNHLVAATRTRWLMKGKIEYKGNMITISKFKKLFLEKVHGK